MAKVNLGHTRLSHASEMCQEATLYRNAYINQDMKILCMQWKKELFQLLE